MELFKVMGLLSTIALALPIITLITFKLAWYRSFPALFAYYLLIFIFNILLIGSLNVSSDTAAIIDLVKCLLKPPLLICFLIYFSRTTAFRKKMQALLYSFLGYEIIIMSVYGFTSKATTIITAPGLILVLAIALLFFIHQIKITIVYHKAPGKALITASLLFGSVGYSYYYAVFYILNTPYKNDARLIFFLTTIISSICMAIGVFLEQKRVKQLEELKITREELKEIYGDNKKTTAPFEAIVLNFNNEN